MRGAGLLRRHTSGQLVKSGNSQSYSKGGVYSAFSGMWGVFIGINSGIVYNVTQKVVPPVFPAATEFNWNVTPDSRYTGINGFLHVDYGNYDDSPGSITPWQVYQLTACSLNVTWVYTGNTSTGLLSELWLCSASAASGSLTKVYEVGFLPKMSSGSLAFATGLPAVGTGSFVSNSVTWNVGLSIGGAQPYLVAYRADHADHQGVLPFLDYLTFLTNAHAITGNEWVNGIGFGPEPLNGAATLKVTSFSGTQTGAAAVPGVINDLSATVASSTSVTLAWTAAPGVTTSQYQLNGGTWNTVSGSNVGATITGLTASTSYTFNVRGVNATGNGAASNTASATTSAAGAADVLTNGNFSSGTTGWTGFGSGGKSVTGGAAVFGPGGTAFDGISQNVTYTAGKYYEVTYTISGYTSGTPQFRFSGGGTDRQGSFRSANGTYVERGMANTGNTNFLIYPGTNGAGFTLDNISCIGPYNTSTVGGA